MNTAVSRPSAGDLAHRIEHFEVEAKAFSEACRPLAALISGRYFDPAAGRDELHRFRSIWMDHRISGLSGQLQSLSAPATRNEIAMSMAGLLASFPSSGNGSGAGEVYGRFLVEDVAASQPSILVLKARRSIWLKSDKPSSRRTAFPFAPARQLSPAGVRSRHLTRRAISGAPSLRARTAKPSRNSFGSA